MKAQTQKSSALRIAHALLALSLPTVASAANVTWNGSTDGDWMNTNNWSASSSGIIAGSTTGTTNTDVAVFKTNPTNKAVTIGSANLNVAGITFDTSSVGAFTIGTTSGNPLLLSSSGTVQMTSTVAASQVINAPLVIQNAASSSSGVYSIQNNASSSTNTLTIGGSITGAATSGSTILTYAGTNAGANTISGVISDGSAGGMLALTKDGAGTLVLSGSNSYSGLTYINSGVLKLTNSGALGNSSLTMNNASTSVALQLSGNITVNNSIALTGVGLGSNGVLQNVSGSNTLTNFKFAQGSSARLSITAGSTLDIVNNITVTSGAAPGIRILGGGTLQLDGDNSSGLGGVVLGTSGTGGLTVKVGNNRSLGTGNLTFDASSTLQSKDATAYSLSNTLIFNATATTVTFGAASTGNLTFTGAASMPGNLILAIGNAQTTMAGAISGTGSLTKSGTGTLLLTGSNTYTGATGVSQGMLTIQHANALGTTAGSTTVSSGGALGLQGGITVGAESLSLSGSGVSNGGALRNISGNNTYGGSITLAADARINSDAGTLTLSNGTVTGSGYGLAIGGAGNTTISSSITTGTGSLTLDGSGVVTLSGSNSYSGNTYLNGGLLMVTHSNALGNSSLTTNSESTTAALQLSGNVTLSNSIALAGIGMGGAGILQNVSGTNTLTNFKFAQGSSARLSVANGSTLDITNGITATSGTALGIRVLGGGTLQLDSDNSAGLGGVVLGSAGVGGLTVKVGNDKALGNGTVTFDANSTIQSKDSTAYTLGNTLAFTANSSAVTFGADSTGNLTLNGGVTLPGSLALSIDNAQTTMNGAISGAGSLTKSGTGTLVLSASNTYAGSTMVSSGKLAVNGSLASGTATVGSGATLGGAGTVKGVTFVNDGGTLAGDGLTLTGLSTFSGSSTLAGITYANGGITAAAGSTLSLSGTTTTGLLSVLGGATLNGAGKVNGNVNVTNGMVNGSGMNVAGIATFSGASTLAGSLTANSGITVASGGALNVAGATASTVTVNSAVLSGSGSTGAVVLASGTLNGTLSTGVISGTGLVSPGNSPGILTATSVAVSSGLDFAFEFTLANASPDYSNTTASGNDILHLTSANPFSSNLTTGNLISVYLDSAALGDTYLGGFFTKLSEAELLTAVKSASFAFYLKDTDGNYDGDILFNGHYYTSLDSSLIALSSTSVINASFSTGIEPAGSELQFTVVPEPSTWAMIIGGVGMIVLLQPFRRRISA